MRRVVFLSSTGKDLHPYRDAVIAHLAKLDHFDCEAMENFGARDASAIPFCRERVRTSDIYVGLIGHYRGWESPDDPARRSITEMEYDWACEPPVKPRLLYIAPEDFELPGPASGDGEAARQAAFRERLMAAHIVDQKHFDTPEALAGAVVRGLSNHMITELLLERSPGERTASDERGDPFALAADAAAQVAADENIDPAVLAQQGVDVAEIEARLATRAAAHEAKGQEERRISARYHRQIGALAFLHDTQKAMRAYTKATELDPDDPDGWNQLGRLQRRIGALDAAKQSYGRVLALGNRLEDRAWQAAATGNLGLIYRTQGDLTRAEAMHQRALALSEELGSKEGVAIQSGNLGLIYQTQGDLTRAEAMFLKGLAIDEELGRKEGIAAKTGNLGLIHQTQGDLTRAEAMHQRQLDLAEELGSKEQQAIATGNLGLIYQTQGDLTRAEAMFKRDLALSEELGSKEGQARATGNLGLIYRTQGDLTRAEAMFKRDLALSEELGSKEQQAAATGNLGSLYQQQGDLTRACAHWGKALGLFREVGMKPQIEQVEGWMREAGCPET